MKVVPIVEGHGEQEAVPILLRRLVTTCGGSGTISRPIRIPKGKLVKEPELRRAIQLAARQSTTGDAILVLIDADGDCPANLGPTLLAWARSERGDRRIAVVVATREFEAWFVAAAESLVAAGKLAPGTKAPPDPERLTDPKGWLARAMGHHYAETIDQPAFAALFDLDAAMHCASFAKLRRDFSRLLAEDPGPTG